MDLIKPPRLKRGDRIGVAAVSGPVDAERLNRGIAFLAAKGYDVVEASNLRSRSGFLAGTDRERAEAYLRLLGDDSVRAIFFARGGYGSSRVLSRIDPEIARAHPKIHLGGSDLTALFAFLERSAGLVTFYGPMVAVDLTEPELDWERVLFGETPDAHAFGPDEVIRSGRAEGALTGGCLSLIASLAGTPEALRGEGRILFWEDTGEEIYRLDRLLTQLERSGTLQGLQGMVIGSVVPPGNADPPDRIRAFLHERFAQAPFPVACGLPAGHLRNARTIPLGTVATLHLGASPRLSFHGPAVA